MIDFEIILQSENLLLRPLDYDDFDSLKKLTEDPGMWTYFTSDLSKPEKLQKWLETAVLDMSDKKRLAFVIVDQKTSELIGSTSIGNISARDKRVELGWTWISKTYQGKGYNEGSKFLLLQYCFEKCGFERVELKTDVLHIAARTALAKMGITEEGMLRSHTLMNGNRRRDTIYYGILKDEWARVKSKLSEVMRRQQM